MIKLLKNQFVLIILVILIMTEMLILGTTDSILLIICYGIIKAGRFMLGSED